VALITETGVGLADAESFCTVAFATEYHANRGNTAWATLGSDTDREQKLRIATDYIETFFGSRWAGSRVSTDQALSWPRSMVPVKDVRGAYYTSDSIPPVIVKACAELALRAIKGELAPDIRRLAKRVKVDVIETEYVDGAVPYTRFRAIDAMLEPFLFGSDMNVKLVRA
jgi:hypothetical protein